MFLRLSSLAAPQLLLSCFILILISVTTTTTATDHIVGANKGWNPGINYTQWSKNQTFYVGDLIYKFFWKSFNLELHCEEMTGKKCDLKKVILTCHLYIDRDIPEEKFLSELHCTDYLMRNFVPFYTAFRYQKTQYNVFEVNQTSYGNCTTDGAIRNGTSGKDFFPLPKAKRYYFIGGNGQCFNGMKVSIIVHPLPKSAVSTNGTSSKTHSAAGPVVGCSKSLRTLFLVVFSIYWGLF
ncbi:early nodulin-like protein 17 [Rutidosis leptorrhynchoides]|uniref:early nodulin-like protein 17 n=1 Tax=Rutidosis leptorrhynchoides TaxID=125765 RepID=UPI003A998EB0